MRIGVRYHVQMASVSDVAPAEALSPRVLRQRFSALVNDWRTSLRGVWNPLQASAMHEELERLAAAADAQGTVELAEPALALTVFLCSFVDAGIAPTAAQRSALERLLEAVANAVGAAAPNRDVLASRQAFLVSPQPESEAELAQELGRRGFVVRPFERIERAVAALAATTPEVLIVDDDCLAELHALTEAIERSREAHRDMPFCLLLADAPEPARVLFAQRAGADAIVPRNDPLQALSRLDELQAQRHSLGFRVLVVDDDRAQSKFCESVLRHRGIQTQACERAADVLAAVETFRPDLVLLDFYLPDGNGIDVAQQIRAIPAHALLPLVFLSGEHDLDRRFDAISMGGDDFLTKPIKPRHLLMTVESRVRRARHMAAVAPSHGERRGTLVGRDTFVRELVAATQEPAAEHTVALLYVRADAVAAARGALGFVAAGDLSQQLAAAVAAELAFARPVCAAGDDSFLALARFDDPLVLRGQLETARAHLAQRRWAAAPQLAFEFTLGALRLDVGCDVDAAIRRVRSLVEAVQRDGGARCVFEFAAARAAVDATDPQDRLVRALLRSPFRAESVAIEYQPLIPLRGEVTGQFVLRMALQPPGSSRSLRIEAAEYAEIARRHGLESAIDRHLLRGAIAALSHQPERGGEMRFYVPVFAAGLREAAFAPWLAAELRAFGVPSHALALTLAVSDLDAVAPGEAALDAVARAGVRLGLELDDPTAARRWLALPNISIASIGAEASAALAAQARELGKIVVAGVDDPRRLGERLRLDVHYLRGEALAAWLARPEFDFSDAVL